MSSVIASRHITASAQKFDLCAALRKGFKLNPLLTIAGLAMIVILVGTLIGIVVDHRVITGSPAWVKPSKFAISVAFYNFTLLWMLSFIQSHKRLVSVIANVLAVASLIEMGGIILQVVRGTTSHFNLTTPLNAAIFQTMGVLITVLWLTTLLAAILLLRQRMSNPVFAWSLRLGILLALVGMAVAFLMTLPTATQLAAIQASGRLTYMGAHSVGVADGGPGLPYLGWSTIGGDLRIAHFVGLHALQLIPLVGWLLMHLQTSSLRIGHKVALLWTFSMSYLGLITLLTWQALRAQSIIAPDALTLQAFALLVAGTVLAGIAIMTHARMK